jgi:Cof subfamily protein (haloacid dehalogenase superfamily)
VGPAQHELRLVATDLDGTIAWGTPPECSPRTVEVVAALGELGITVVLVTARPPRAVVPITRQLRCHAFALCSNGALVYDAATDRVVRQYSLDPSTARQIVEALRRDIPDIAFAVEGEAGFGHEPTYVPGEDPPTETVVAEVEQLIAAPMAKLLARHPSYDTDTLIDLARRAVGDIAPLHNSGGASLLEFSAPGVSKALALEHLTHELGLGADAVIAFGDMPNDIPMLTWAGRGVAVENAHPDLLAVADDTCGPCEGDGVANYLAALFELPRASSGRHQTQSADGDRPRSRPV